MAEKMVLNLTREEVEQLELAAHIQTGEGGVNARDNMRILAEAQKKLLKALED